MKNRIIFLVHSLHVGGMERVMVEIANYLCNKRKIEIHFVLFGSNPVVFYELDEKVIVHKPKSDLSNGFNIVSVLGRIRFVRQKVKGIKPDCILSFGELWNSFVLLSLLGIRKRIYISDRCQPDKSYGKFHDFLRSILYPLADGMIAQTDTAKNIYDALNLNKNIITIGNPIKDFYVCPEVKREKIILTVGRLIQTKNHDELIRIFSEISNHEWKLVIVGADAQKQSNFKRLNLLIEELGLQERVELIGQQNDMQVLYNKASIFVFASSSEGFPNVIGEAMSTKLPVIAYDCIAGPSDLIQSDDTGYLIKLFDREAFKKKLQHLINSEQLCREMGEKGRSFVLNNFSTSVICEKYDALFCDNWK